MRNTPDRRGSTDARGTAVGLENVSGAALLVDVDEGTVLDATSKGAELLDLPRARAGPPWLSLDAAMPGLARLRNLAQLWLDGAVAAAPATHAPRDGDHPAEADEPLMPAPARAIDAAPQARAHVRMPSAARPRTRSPSLEQPSNERLLFWTTRGSLTLACRIHFERRDGRLLALIEDCTPSSVLPGCTGATNNADKLSARSPTDTAERAQQAPSPDAPTELFAKLAHELKTPLSAIATASEIMMNERLGSMGNDRYVSYAYDIHAGARHVLGLVERLLGNVHPGAVPALDFAEIDANAILASTVSQMRPIAERGNIALDLRLAPRLPHVVADATSLRQIVLNLLTNALKFTAGGGRVTVASRYDIGGALAIEIRDTGRGMSRGELDRYLDALHPPRLEPREGGGLGIGLPLVRSLAAANGAALAIDSTPGAGTCAAIVFAKDRIIPV